VLQEGRHVCHPHNPEARSDGVLLTVRAEAAGHDGSVGRSWFWDFRRSRSLLRFVPRTFSSAGGGKTSRPGAWGGHALRVPLQLKRCCDQRPGGKIAPR
jgi:hypothetical protein